jgi:predicted Holliday junction resolvase-like endonuclease
MGFEIPALIGGLIVGALLVYILLAQRSKQQARTLLNEWMAAGKMQIEKEADQKAEQKHGEIARLNLEVWKSTELQRVKEEDQKSAEMKQRNALDTQRDVLKGKIGEQMAPLFPEFRNRYNPADARFIGSPIDYIIFKNLSKVDSAEEAPLEIVFVDVKTGKAGLTKAQQMIERAVSGEKKRVDFYTLRLDIAQHSVDDSFGEKVLSSSESKKAIQ